MAITNDGGSAFPYGGGSDGPFPGMSLRDWFAGQAIMALPHIGCGADLEPESFALAAYQIADAMLVAREAPQ